MPSANGVFVDRLVVDFGPTRVGRQAHASLTLRNESKSDRHVAALISPPFTGPESVEIAAAVSVELSLSFAPQSVGDAFGSAQLEVEGMVLTVELRGKGLPALACATTHACRDARYDAETDACVEDPAPDGRECSSSCLTNGTCSAGECRGSPIRCDDANPCTDDACSAEQGCFHVDATARCEAEAGPCRAGFCDPVSGCQATAIADGTSCGAGDCRRAQVCFSGTCEWRPRPSLPDLSTCVARQTIAIGDEHICAIVDGGRVHCRGDGRDGELGNGGRQRADAPVHALGVANAVSIEAGSFQSYAVLADGSVYGWGAAPWACTWTSFDVPQVVPGPSSVVKASVGYWSGGACFLERDGRVFCAGSWAYGFLGEPAEAEPAPRCGVGAIHVPGVIDAVDVDTEARAACVVRFDGTVWCWGNSPLRGPLVDYEMDYWRPTQVPGIEGAVSINVGVGHACASLEDGGVACWGNNVAKQLGRDDGGANNEWLAPGPPDVLRPWRTISPGSEATCALAHDGGVACWGTNGAGALGSGGDAGVVTAMPTRAQLPAVRELGHGGSGTWCARDLHHRVWCWGNAAETASVSDFRWKPDIVPFE